MGGQLDGLCVAARCRVCYYVRMLNGFVSCTVTNDDDVTISYVRYMQTRASISCYLRKDCIIRSVEFIYLSQM